MNDLENLYKSSNDIKIFNDIFQDLKLVAKEYFKAKFPIVSVLDTLRQQKLKQVEEERLNKFFQNTSNKIKYLSDNKLDKDFIESEEFIRLFLNISNKVKEDYREKKIEYYSNLLLNYTTINFSKDFYKEGIIERLSKYSIEHILVLDEAYSLFKTNPVLGSMQRGTFNKQNIKVENLDEQIIELCIIDLRADGLLYEVTGFRFDAGTPEYFIITEYGIKCLELICDNYNLRKVAK